MRNISGGYPYGGGMGGMGGYGGGMGGYPGMVIFYIK